MLTARSGWRTSSYSSNGDDCFEVEPVGRTVRLRHSKHPDGPVITFSWRQWDRWLTELRAGEIDNSNGTVHVVPSPTGWTVEDLTGGAVLRFDNGEVAAFLRGVLQGEFDVDIAEDAPAA